MKLVCSICISKIDLASILAHIPLSGVKGTANSLPFRIGMAHALLHSQEERDDKQQDEDEESGGYLYHWKTWTLWFWISTTICVCADDDGNIVVANPDKSRIQIFDKNGKSHQMGMFKVAIVPRDHIFHSSTFNLDTGLLLDVLALRRFQTSSLRSCPSLTA